MQTIKKLFSRLQFNTPKCEPEIGGLYHIADLDQFKEEAKCIVKEIKNGYVRFVFSHYLYGEFGGGSMALDQFERVWRKCG